jgi:hypothetical protein
MITSSALLSPVPKKREISMRKEKLRGCVRAEFTCRRAASGALGLPWRSS